MEKEKSCLFDSVSLYDGEQEKASTRLGHYCGHRRPPDAVSTGPVVLIVLQTDKTVNDGGFKVKWTSEISKGWIRCSALFYYPRRLYVGRRIGRIFESDCPDCPTTVT